MGLIPFIRDKQFIENFNGALLDYGGSFCFNTYTDNKTIGRHKMKSPYKTLVTFNKRTEILGVEIKDSVKHVDVEHAKRWVKVMVNKIWNVEIKEIKS